MIQNSSLLKIVNLSVEISSRRGKIYAVNNLSFEIYRNEIFGLVGESGSGKSVTAMSIVKLLPRNAKYTGSIEFDGLDVFSLSKRKLNDLRRNKIAMIFQDPVGYLNPVLKIEDQMTEVLDSKDPRDRIKSVLESVGLSDAEQVMKSYPNQLSGGMSQRVMIAMALIRDPELIIADEITTALDVTVQAQILSLLNNIRKEFGLSVLFITHDLGVVAQLCDRVAVMYGGTIVEEAPVRALFSSPKHPYTQGLLQAVPRIDKEKELKGIPGTVTDVKDPVINCPYNSRCSFVWQRCVTVRPLPITLESGEHVVSCHLFDDGVQAA